MSLLLSDKGWVMLSEVAKRRIYPTHSAKLGIYRLPVDIVGQSEVNGIMSELKSQGSVLDTYADRIVVTFKWVEKGFDIRFESVKGLGSIRYQQSIIDNNLHFRAVEFQSVFLFQYLSDDQCGTHCLGKLFLR